MAIACLAALAVYAIALCSPAIFNDGDTYWHIRAGQWMLAHRAVLDHDVFSQALVGKPWLTQEWLSEVLMAAAYQLAGWSGVAILTGVSMAVTAMLLGLFLGKRLDPLPCIVALVLSVACLIPDFLARPHILALPFMTIWVIEIAAASAARRRPSWLLLPVMTIWANLHGGFIFGLALLAPMACESILNGEKDRARVAVQWALFALGAVAAALINPHGIKGLVYPFELMQVQSLAAVGEWQPLDLRQFNPVEFSALAAAFFFIWHGIRVRPIRLLVLIALFHQTLVHARYGLVLGITGPALLADSLSAGAERGSAPGKFRQAQARGLAALAGVLFLCAAIRIARPIERVEGPASPIVAFASVPPSLAAEPVFNNYAFGGFLIFNGAKPFVDSRADFYGDAYLADYWKVVSGDRAAVARIFARNRVKWTILAPGDPLIAVLDRCHGWRRLITSPYAVVHVGPSLKMSAR